MSERAALPLGHHPNWLPFVAALELVLQQVGDPDEAMKNLTSAQHFGQVRSLLLARGVRRLMTSADFDNPDLDIDVPAYWGDDGRKKLTREWREETTIELHGEPVLVFVWQPDLEEFLGLRSAAAHEAKEPVGPVEQPEKESGAATPEQKSVKPRTTVQHDLTVAALDRLREEHLDKYSKGFSKARPNIVESQMKPIWKEVCKAGGQNPDEYPLPNRTMISRAMKNYRVRI